MLQLTGQGVAIEIAKDNNLNMCMGAVLSFVTYRYIAKQFPIPRLSEIDADWLPVHKLVSMLV
jgi:hypothetical protein